jgi:lysophospholipase L1-like esterase
MFKHPASRRAVLGGALAAAATIALPARAAAPQAGGGKHIVLLGDSILDNGAYVGSGPDVAQQLRKRLPANARATLTAVDGSVTSGVRLQLQLVPADATHLVVSAGGNDAMHYSKVLEEKASSVSEALDKLAEVRERFVADYRAMLDDVAARGLPAACCTIYDPRFPDKTQRRLASVGLTIFNECITREASARGLALIDLRLICRNDEDLANPIEPSVIGGAKIASAIAAFVAEYDWSRGRSEVFAQTGGKI